MCRRRSAESRAARPRQSQSAGPAADCGAGRWVLLGCAGGVRARTWCAPGHRRLRRWGQEHGTGHAESVEVTFDPARISFGEILQVFFAVAHNPTELNRQGPDVGAQYRSEIFYVDDAQRQIAQAYIAQLDRSHAFARPIVTRVEPLKGIYAAEDYHQDFLVHNPHSPYIVFNDLPKIENLRRELPSFYVTEPVLVARSDGVNRP
jgi:methionine-S-sulfoxide reductase